MNKRPPDRPSTREIFLAVPPAEVAYVQAVLDSYEGIAIVRTADSAKAVIVVLAMADFADVVEEILTDLKREIPLQETTPLAGGGEDWLLAETAS
jgi:hypothetical protein